jgi:O-antigen/teichoic acid export membrane protein
MGSAWGSRVITALVQILSIPLLLEYLGPLKYSWVVVAFSLQAWWLLTDFGVSTSLQNAISKSRTMKKGDDDLILSAASIVIPMAIILAIILGFCYQQMANLLLPPTANRDGSGGELILVTGLFSLLLVVGNIGNRVFYARHKGYWANIIPAVGSLITLVGLFALKSDQNNKSLILAMSVWIGPTAILSSGSFCFICLKAFYRNSGGPTLNICNNLIKKGGEFTLFGIFGALTLQIDYLIIGKLLSDGEILIYVIASKCMGIIIFFYGSVVQAFWPICSEASASNKWSAVDKILKKMIVIGFVMTIIGSLFIWVFQAEIINLIAPNQDLMFPALLWILFLVYALIRVWSDVFAMLLQSMNKMKIFLIYIPFQALISVYAQIELTKKFGLNGLLLGSIISFVFTSIWILPFAYKKIKNEN